MNSLQREQISNHETRPKQLQETLDLGKQEVAAGKIKRVADVITQLRAKRYRPMTTRD